MRFHHLTVFRLHDEAPASVQDARLAQLRGCRAHAAIQAMAGRLYGDQLHLPFIQKMIKGACGITSAAHAGDQMGRQFAGRLFPQLRPDLLR